MGLTQSPLIPANAGIQMADSEVGWTSAAYRHLTLARCDLGPGIRRDERVF
jgi:hypothetical protein